MADKNRTVYRLQLTASATKKLKAESSRTGITQIAMGSKLMEWFAKQPDEIKSAVLDLYPSSVSADVGRLILERMAASPRV